MMGSCLCTQSQLFNISDGIDGSPISYTIIYSNATTGDICLNATLPASECQGGVCHHYFYAYRSECSPQGNVSVSVYATNILGDGPVSNPVRITLSRLQFNTHMIYKQLTAIIM